MPLLTVDNILKSFGEKTLLNGVSFRVNEGDKIAFIGNNGAGKSTLFKIIKGTVRADSGNILIHGNTIVGFLSQNMDEQDLSSNSLKPKAITELEAEKTILEHELAAISDYEDEAEYKRVMDEYSKVTARYDAIGGYDYEFRINDALAGLGLTGLNDRTDYSTLSGGEKMRVCLAQLIVARPDILMLDEPTNHLDIDAIEWLENFLSSYGGSVFVISHDRHFIDKVANRVIEITDGNITEYKGNYSDYKIQKEEFIKMQQLVVSNLETQLEHQLDVKQTMLSHRNISGYHQREKMVDKLSDVLMREKAKLSNGVNTMNFKFTNQEREGASDKILISVQDVAKKFDDDPDILFEHISFELKANEKIFLCGPNGCGKSTLLSMLLGRQGGFDGSVFISETAECGFMGQFVPFDNEELSCLDELLSRTDLSETSARNMLARFGFRDIDVFKQIKVLSGGERSRLYLCCLLQERPDILFLDEPTNHLDIQSREVLEDALTAYNGAIVCVSHDRFFIEKCADIILGFIGKSAELFDQYRFYRNTVMKLLSTPVQKEEISEEEQLIKQEREIQQKADGVSKSKARKLVAKMRTRVRDLENEIDKLEARQKELEAAFTEGASEAEYNEYADNSAKIDAFMEEYMELSDQLDQE